MRILVGSLGLISTVPVTTAIAVLFALRADSLGKWRQVVDPDRSGLRISIRYEHWSEQLQSLRLDSLEITMFKVWRL